MNTKVEQKYFSILERINAARKKLKVVAMAKGTLFSAAICLTIILFAILAENYFYFSPSNRIIFDLIILILIAAVWLIFVGIPVFSLFYRKNTPSDADLARKIGESTETVGDRLVNAIQVFKLRTTANHGLSEDLIDQSVMEIDKDIKSVDFRNSINTAPIKKAARILILTVAFFSLLAIIFSHDFYNASVRLLNPSVEFKKTPDFEIFVQTGNIQVIKNEPVEIRALVIGKSTEKMNLFLKDVHANNLMNYELSPVSENEFSFHIEHVQDSTEYYFQAGDVVSSKYMISVVELPLVRHLQIKISPPRYSRLSEKLLEENVGDISCLKGSVVDLNIHCNKSLENAWLKFENEKRVDLNVSSTRANGQFSVYEDGNYTIQLVDKFKMENRDPIQYRISVIEDIYPTVAITIPGQDVDITEEMLLPLTIEAEDDFGFTSMNLAYQLIKQDIAFRDTSMQYVPIPINSRREEKLIKNFDWDLAPVNLFAGDIVRYFVEVFDNDKISGPKRAKSAVYSARFPTLEEIFSEVNSEQAETYESFEGLYEKSKDLKDNIDKLVEEVKQNPELKWEEKKNVEDIVQKQKQMAESLEEVQEKLDQMIERMERNDLLGVETLEKYHELQELMNDLFSEELKEAIKKLQDAAKNVNPEELMQAIEQLNFTQENFLKNIEKTLNILKRLQLEQKLDELVKTAEDLLNKQTNVNEEMQDNASGEQQNELGKNQKEIKNDTEELLSDIDQLNENMNEFADMPSDKLDAALEQMDQQEVMKKMDEVLAQLRSGNMQRARSNGKMAQNSLAELSDLLKSAKNDVIEAQKQQVMAELKRLSHNMLSLSKRQENILRQSKKLNRNSPQITDAAENQQNLLSALSRTADKMAGLSKKTFFVTKKMGRAVGQSLREMDQALAEMEQRNFPRASRAQQQSMMYLDEAVKEIMNSMNNLSSSSSSTGFEEMMEQLSQMAGKQQGINNQTMQLGMGQQLTLSQQASMARLAAEQAALQKTLEQLQSQMGERSDVLGRLDQLGKEMGDVVKDLQGRKVSQKTINRQQRILQRLLDAQRSVRKQDYSRKRKAETAKHYSVRSPGKLNSNLGEKNIQLQRDLLKALKEGYSKDYQELIRKYFEALMEESLNDEKIR